MAKYTEEQRYSFIQEILFHRFGFAGTYSEIEYQAFKTRLEGRSDPDLDYEYIMWTGNSPQPEYDYEDDDN